MRPRRRTLRALGIVALVLFAACGKTSGSSEPARAIDAPDAALPVDAAPAPGDAARALLPYPAGPYGTGVGDTMPNFELVGYALSHQDNDSTHLPFRSIRLAEARDASCTCMIVALTANGTQCQASIIHDRTLTALRTKDPTLCAIEVSFFNHDGIGPGVMPQDQPPTRGDIDAFTQSGRENFPVGIPTQETRRALTAFSIAAVPTSYVVRASDMKILSLYVGAGDNFALDLPKICATQAPPVETIAAGLAPRHLAMDATYVYATDAARGIVRLPTAGGPVETLARPAASADAIALDDDFVYWATHDGSANEIARVAKAGGVPEQLLASDSGFVGLARDGSNLYFTRTDGMIGRFSLADHTVGTLAQGEAAPTDIITAGDYVFWIASGAREVARMPKTGGARESMVQGGAQTVPWDPTALTWFNGNLVVGTSYELYTVVAPGAAPDALTNGTALFVRGFAVEPDGQHLVTGSRDPDDAMGVIGEFSPSHLLHVAATVTPLTAGQEDVGAVASDGTYVVWTVHANDIASGGAAIRRKRLR